MILLLFVTQFFFQSVEAYHLLSLGVPSFRQQRHGNENENERCNSYRYFQPLRLSDNNQEHDFTNNPPDDNSIGLVLSGGADRSFAACAGILRGLQQKEIIITMDHHHPNGTTPTTITALQAVRYMSANSGGVYPACIYSFAQIPTNELLETHRSPNPEHITQKELEYIPKTSMVYPITRNPLYSIANPLRLPRILKNILKLQSWWSGLVYWTYLKRFGIKRGKYFASSEQEVEQIIIHDEAKATTTTTKRITRTRRRRRRRLSKKDFIWPRNDTTALPIFLTSMAGPRKGYNEFQQNVSSITKDAWLQYKLDEILCSRSRYQDRFKLNMTKCILDARSNNYGSNLMVPFTISPREVRVWYQGDMEIGESPHNIQFPRKDTKPFEWGGKKTRFSIEMAAAMSTNVLGWNFGPLSHIRKIPGCSSSTSDNNSSSSSSSGSEDDKEMAELLFYDGGMSDTCGLVPLVQRGVRNIICVFPFNKNPPYSSYSTRYSDIYKAAPLTDTEDEHFENDFKTWLSMFSRDIGAYFGYFGPEYDSTCTTLLNHVFHDPNFERLRELKIKLNLLYEAGEPLIATLENLEVINNPFWGTKAGKKVDLTLIYFNMPRKFSERVPVEAVPPPTGLAKLDDAGYFNNEEFSQVPELPFDLPKKGLTYQLKQVNMVCYLGSWMVHRGWDPLKDNGGNVQFKGFREIFSKRG